MLPFMTWECSNIIGIKSDRSENNSENEVFSGFSPLTIPLSSKGNIYLSSSCNYHIGARIVVITYYSFIIRNINIFLAQICSRINRTLSANVRWETMRNKSSKRVLEKLPGVKYAGGEKKENLQYMSSTVPTRTVEVLMIARFRKIGINDFKILSRLQYDDCNQPSREKVGVLRSGNDNVLLLHMNYRPKRIRDWHYILRIFLGRAKIRFENQDSDELTERKIFLPLCRTTCEYKRNIVVSI